MGILKIKGIPKLVVFGGYSHVNDTYPSIVEVWNDDTETWHIFENVKLYEPEPLTDCPHIRQTKVEMAKSRNLANKYNICQLIFND